jgi:hypothetical protein
MVRRRQQAADRAVRPKLRSPGHPRFSREVEGAFWVEIARGLLPEEAAAVVGVSQPVGARWFHNAGGMPPFDLNKKLTDRYLVGAWSRLLLLPGTFQTAGWGPGGLAKVLH